MTLTTAEVIRATKGELLLGDPRTAFSGISINTRTLRKGECFVAIAGPHFDGHRFLSQALERGAAGVIVRDAKAATHLPVDALPDIVRVPDTIVALQNLARAVRQSSSASIIGITGSNGKTTTKDMLAAILTRAGKTLATRGNLNNHLGLPLTLLGLEADHQFAILEMGASMDGDIAILADIAKPQVGLITNIGHAHLERLKTPEGVLAVKRALYDALPKKGLAVINLDDPHLAPLAGTLPCRKMTFGLTAPEADVRAESIQDHDIPLRFNLKITGKVYPVALAIPGRFQVYNALAAAAVAHGLGLSAEDIVAGLESFTPTAMRMQIVPHRSGGLIINDAYNANPSSVRASVHGLVQTYPQRVRWVVLGDMRELGDRARAEHRELGTWLAAQPLDRIFLYGRDTRFVEESARAAGLGPDRLMRFRKKRDLLAHLEKGLEAKPVILFKASRRLKLEEIIDPLVK